MGKYLERHQNIIDGKVPADELNPQVLRRIRAAALAQSDDEVIEIVNRRYREMRDAGVKMRRNPSSEYSPHQLDILNGSIPYDQITPQAIRRVKEATSAKGDTEVFDAIAAIEAYGKEYGFPYEFYTKPQRAVLSGEKPLETVNMSALDNLFKRALRLNDSVVAARVQRMIQQKQRNQFDRVYSYRIRQAKEKIERQERRKMKKEFDEQYLKPYSTKQRRAIKGELPQNQITPYLLRAIEYKAQVYGDSAILAIVNDLWEARKSHRRAEKSNKDEYTKNELRIINGEVSWEEAGPTMLFRIRKKAMRREDKDIYDLADKTITDRGIVRARPVCTAYTENQMKLINGELPYDMASTTLIRILLETATMLGDDDVIELANRMMEQRKQEQRVRKQQRKSKCKYVRRHLIVDAWAPAKNKVYTAKQKEIINGNIPYDDVNTNELILLHQKAMLCGDTDIVDTTKELIMERYRIIDEKERMASRMYNRRKVKGFMPFGTTKYAYSGDPRRTKLTRRDYEILQGNISLYDCTEAEMSSLVRLCHETGDENLIFLAETQYNYFAHPETLYTTQKSHAETVREMEDLLGIKITRPGDKKE